MTPLKSMANVSTPDAQTVRSRPASLAPAPPSARRRAAAFPHISPARPESAAARPKCLRSRLPQLVIQPFDKSTVKDIERAIQMSDLGINPSNDGNLVRLNIPPLTQARAPPRRSSLLLPTRSPPAHHRGLIVAESRAKALACPPARLFAGPPQGDDEAGRQARRGRKGAARRLRGSPLAPGCRRAARPAASAGSALTAPPRAASFPPAGGAPERPPRRAQGGGEAREGQDRLRGRGDEAQGQDPEADGRARTCPAVRFPLRCPCVVASASPRGVSFVDGAPLPAPGVCLFLPAGL